MCHSGQPSVQSLKIRPVIELLLAIPAVSLQFSLMTNLRLLAEWQNLERARLSIDASAVWIKLGFGFKSGATRHGKYPEYYHTIDHTINKS